MNQDPILRQRITQLRAERDEARLERNAYLEALTVARLALAGAFDEGMWAAYYAERDEADGSEVPNPYRATGGAR